MIKRIEKSIDSHALLFNVLIVAQYVVMELFLCVPYAALWVLFADTTMTELGWLCALSVITLTIHYALFWICVQCGALRRTTTAILIAIDVVLSVPFILCAIILRFDTTTAMLVMVLYPVSLLLSRGINLFVLGKVFNVN
ncbi:MAG: hypothetical protein PHT58_00775 [Eubacteriales bacterium]|nr:hypothetical protein [Eubacteriales bacterium]